MDNLIKRYLLFLFGCIPARLLLTYLAYKQYKIIPYITFIIGFSFWFIYLTNSRKTGAEVFGDKIWWNNLRPLHGSLYIMYSLAHLRKFAWILLLIDTLICFISFIMFHFILL